MQLPLQITVRNMSLSAAAEANIRSKAEQLDKFCDCIMRCHVVVEAPHRHHRKGVLFHVRIDLTVPGSEIIIKRESDEDVYVAIRDAFDAARRKLQDYMRLRRGKVKMHEEPPAAYVSKLFADGGYGFLQTPDGREIYFHQNSVLPPGFDKLKVGTMVRFSEEMGEKGPQASTVAILAKG